MVLRNSSVLIQKSKLIGTNTLFWNAPQNLQGDFFKCNNPVIHGTSFVAYSTLCPQIF